MITEDAGALPASHGVVSVQHLFAQLAVLDPTGELNVSELITQQLRPQEALQVSSDTQDEAGQVIIYLFFSMNRMSALLLVFAIKCLLSAQADV